MDQAYYKGRIVASRGGWVVGRWGSLGWHFHRLTPVQSRLKGGCRQDCPPHAKCPKSGHRLLSQAERLCHTFIVRHTFFVIGLFFSAGMIWAQPQPLGQALFQSKCASCHSAEGGAPALATLNAMPTE